MNKIYNNLNIDNLMRTEMFNQFDELQQKKIKIGLVLEDNLDVSIYVNSKYNWKQMYQIRCGLKANLDVSLYGLIKW